MTATTNPALKSSRGNVGRGWRRWVRARDAAYARPNTEGGRLFFSRLERAEKYDATTVNIREFLKWDESAVDYRTCSDFCFTMQAALDFAGQDIGGLVARPEIRHGWRSRVAARKTTVIPARGFTCFVCRRKVTRAGTDEAHRIEFRNPKQELRDVPKRREITAAEVQEREAKFLAKMQAVSAARAQQAAKARSFSVGGLTSTEYRFLIAVLNAHRFAS